MCKMSTGEVMCDYCNVPYSDRRSLKIHELIHTDEDIETFSALSDYLPKAKQLHPKGIRNNRTAEIFYKKTETNSPSNGKLRSKTLFVSEAIEELLYLCQKFPLRGSVESSCENACKIPVVVSSPPIYSALVCSSGYETSLVTSSFGKSTFTDPESALKSELDQNEARYKDSVEHESERNRTDSPVQISNGSSSPDSGYDSPPEEKIYNSESKTSGFRSVFEIKDIIKDLVSRIAIVSDDRVADEKLKLISEPGNKFKLASIENSAPVECATPGLETSVPAVDETVIIDPVQNASLSAFSMPKISF